MIRRVLLACNDRQQINGKYAAQLMRAFPWDTVPPYLLRDRDRIYGDAFRSQAANMAITEVLTAPQSPWQSPFVEPLVGSPRRESFDHLVVVNESTLRRQIARYVDYHHAPRCHLSLEKDSPDERTIQPRNSGESLPGRWSEAFIVDTSDELRELG